MNELYIEVEVNNNFGKYRKILRLHRNASCDEDNHWRIDYMTEDNSRWGTSPWNLGKYVYFVRLVPVEQIPIHLRG